MVHLIFLLFFLYIRGFDCEISGLPDNIVLDESVNNITKICKEKKCIPKCCDKNQIMDENFDCLPTNITHSYLENIPLYDDYYHDKKVNKKLRDVFLLAPSRFNDTLIFYQENKSSRFINVSSLGYKEYLSEGGILYMEYPNSFSRWTPVDGSHFCVDVDSKTMKIQFVVVQDYDNTPDNQILYPIGFIISSVFLFLVLLVYIVLPELRNLAGLVLMAYIFSLLMAFISLTWMKLDEFYNYQCIYMTVFIYYFLLSTFCWMSVMSYDIWWTFRGYAKARKIHRRGEVFKFRMYCIYAWGVPLLMSIGFVVINKMDLSHIPWFVQPQIPSLGCFLTGGQQLIYLYIPILILIICNWLFFLMTVFNIWRLVRKSKILNSAHRSQKNRLMVYFKLSVIMGINWLLEVLSVLTPTLSIWTYTDTYNLLIGFAIFLIFVCKPKIYRKLKARFNTNPLAKKKHHHSENSELESNLTPLTPSPVSPNPDGQH